MSTKKDPIADKKTESGAKPRQVQVTFLEDEVLPEAPPVKPVPKRRGNVIEMPRRGPVVE